jgi:protein kinase A
MVLDNFIFTIIKKQSVYIFFNLFIKVIDVKQHKWFHQIDWMAIYEKRVKAPYLPKEEYEQYDEEPLYISSTEKYAKEFQEF